MVLFVFEGKKPEYRLFEAVDEHFLHIGSEKIVATFHTNFYMLYKQLSEDDDFITLNVLKEWLNSKNDHTLDVFSPNDFSEIYLFFDYDLHAATGYLELTKAKANQQVEKMLRFFNDEYEHGKLFVSYPMIDSYRYTKEMPDPNFHSYTYPIADFANFKGNDLSEYNLDQFTTARVSQENWKESIKQHVSKANFLCTDDYSIPSSKDTIAQQKIFDAEKDKYIDLHDEVSVLCGLPLFVFDYLRPELFNQRVLT